uniref:Methionine aminopeptidase n=1 Tax=Strongyloides stercoralis TaxID=6248 RepID=A0A0K0E0Z9_STRER
MVVTLNKKLIKETLLSEIYDSSLILDNFMLNKQMYSDLFRNFQYTGKIRRGKVYEKRIIPNNISRPDYANNIDGICEEEEKLQDSKKIKRLNDEEIEGVRTSAKLGRKILDEVAKIIDAGIETNDIDNLVNELCIENECYPSPLNYYKFPKSVCTSVNEIICHGIPDDYKLKEGDLCNVDVTVYKNGFHGDLNETFFVSYPSSEEDIHLVTTAYKCLMEAIKIVKPGTNYSEIGNVIETVAENEKLKTVKEYEGHGCHRLFHTTPRIRHFKNNKKGVMKVGHCFTIEPMLCIGSSDNIIWPDDWTVAAVNGKNSAQFEHMVLVTENGCEILTERDKQRPWFIEQLGFFI